MADNDDAFQNLADEVEVPAVVVFTQHEEDMVPGYDIVGDIELDDAIAMTLKGLVLMVLDAVAVEIVEGDEEEG